MDNALRRRSQRALERQLAYQQRKAERLRGREAAVIEEMKAHSAAVRAKLAALRAISADAKILEVGSGAHGLIFFFQGGNRTGVDPLADAYRTMFPAWQGMAKTIAAHGEQLPFPDAGFDIVLCDNVIDHAESPRGIVEELVRVLRPGGLLYFTVNIHHPLYQYASAAHSAWRAIGIPFEITPFADHTVHLTLKAARALFAGLPLTPLQQSNTIAETRAKRLAVRHGGDLLKKFFFKNAEYELIAVRA